MKVILFKDKEKIVGYQTYPLDERAIELTDKEFKKIKEDLIAENLKKQKKIRG